MSAPENWRFETKQIHSGAQPDPVTKARATPIYQTTSYVFDNADHAANLFALAEFGNIYTRIQNPTQAVVEERLAALEGGTGALLARERPGRRDHRRAQHRRGRRPHRVVELDLRRHLQPLQVHAGQARHRDDLRREPGRRRGVARAVRPNTKLFFAETIGNPKINVLDIRPVADVAHENGIPLIVDNTIATPYLIKPFEHGADIVVHSATKFLGGHGTVIGGIIVDGGTFEWSKNVDKFPGLTVPDPRYHGASYTAAVGDGLAYIIKARVQLLRDLGAAISPQSAWLLIQGIETLSLRIERHVQNAQEIAEWLENQRRRRVGQLLGPADLALVRAANKYAPKGVGAVLSFELKGGVEAGREFVNSLTLFSHLANIGDVRSLVIHPASTTHSQLTPEQQLTTGVTPGLVRLSLGLENIDDLKADLEQALAAARRCRRRHAPSLTHPVQRMPRHPSKRPITRLVGRFVVAVDRPEPRQRRHGAVTRRPAAAPARDNGRMDWQTSEDTVPSAPVTEADARHAARTPARDRRLARRRSGRRPAVRRVRGVPHRGGTRASRLSPRVRDMG